MNYTHSLLAVTERPYAQRRALQLYDEASSDLLGGLAFHYHSQLATMRHEDALKPLAELRGLDTTQAARLLHKALTAAFAGKRPEVKRLLRETLAELAEVRFREESFGPEGFFELLHKTGAGYTEDDRAYDAKTALDWLNKTDLGRREDSFVDDDKVVYPRLVVLYTYLDDDETLTSILVAQRHARQKHPKWHTGLSKRLQLEIGELEAQQARAERYQARSGGNIY
jgi:hypothetical protein